MCAPTEQYVGIRDTVRRRAMESEGEGQQTVPITVRQLEALVRISESLAKMRLRPEVGGWVSGIDESRAEQRQSGAEHTGAWHETGPSLSSLQPTTILLPCAGDPGGRAGGHPPLPGVDRRGPGGGPDGRGGLHGLRTARARESRVLVFLVCR